MRMTPYDCLLTQGLEVMRGVTPGPFPRDTYANAHLPGFPSLPPAYVEWPGLFAEEGFGTCDTGFTVEALPLSGHYSIPISSSPMHLGACGYHRGLGHLGGCFGPIGMSAGFGSMSLPGPGMNPRNTPFPFSLWSR